jgi:hypothetical protein
LLLNPSYRKNRNIKFSIKPQQSWRPSVDQIVNDNQWHLDKKVPVALIVTMVSWIVATVWWASAINNRVEVLEELAVKNNSLESRLVRIEEGQNWMKDILKQMSEKLNK